MFVGAQGMEREGTSQGGSSRRQHMWGWQAGAGEGAKEGKKPWLRDGTGKHTFIKPASVSNIAIR